MIASADLATAPVEGSETEGGSGRRTPFAVAGIAGPLIAAVLWFLTLAWTDTGAIGNFGLLSAFPWTMYAGLVVLSVSMIVAVHRKAPTAILAVHVVLLVLMLHATPAILYEALRYSWSWKHVGLVDYFTRHSHPDPSLRYLTVYQNWPGFFAAVTALIRASGMGNAIGIAKWSPPIFEFANACALYVLFSTLSRSRRVTFLGIWFFLVANWVGQDYFSPQAFVYFLYLATLAIVVRHFTRVEHLPAWMCRIATGESVDLQDPEPASRTQQRGYMVAFVLCFAAIAMSHPLTPLVLTMVLVALLVFRRLTLWWLPLFTALATAAWMLTGAYTYTMQNLGAIFNDVGSVENNVSSNLRGARYPNAQQYVSLLGRAVVILVAVVAIVGFLRRLRRGHWELTALLLAAAPAGILVGGSYGGEAVFRVYLFSVPFLAYLAASGMYMVSERPRKWAPIVALGFSSILLAGTLFGYYGKDKWYHFTRSEVRAAEAVYKHAVPGSLLVSGTGDYPIQFVNYEDYTYVTLADEPPSSYERVIANPAGVLHTWLSNPRYRTSYLIITKAMESETDAIGPLPPGSLQNIEKALLASPKFTVVYHDDDAVVFTVAHVRGRT